MRKDIVDKVGGFRAGYDGSQDHDIILRVANESEKVGHIAKILYHWRKVPGSTADVYDAKSMTRSHIVGMQAVLRLIRL